VHDDGEKRSVLIVLSPSGLYRNAAAASVGPPCPSSPTAGPEPPTSWWGMIRTSPGYTGGSSDDFASCRLYLVKNL
jgi:hypothetical protein